MEKSCVQIYTGEGKGKTTAAVGLAVRAAGQGLSVKFVQFLKGRETGELSILSGLPNVECLRAASSSQFFHQLSDDEKAALREDAQRALTIVEGWLSSADLLILDEAMAALSCGIVTLDEVMGIIDKRGSTELVLTGRNVPKQIVQRADLVTEMRAVKHCYDAGLRARRGIEY